MAKFHLFKTTAELENFCQKANRCRFVTMDTEFIRDNTYYPKLCLLQMAILSESYDEIALFDVLSPNMDLAPLQSIFSNPRLIKVMHAAHQDMEIFYQELGDLPKPVFDTQIAARVCGYGYQASYAGLVKGLLNISPDQSSTMTLWSRRPLSASQLSYAAADVDHLRHIFLKIEKKIEESRRITWIKEDLAALTSTSNYITDPDDAWKKVKGRRGKPLYQAAIYGLAKLREQKAQQENVPRHWIMRDEVLCQIAHRMPTSIAELKEVRSFDRSKRRTQIDKQVLDVLRWAESHETCFKDQQKRPFQHRTPYNIELLKVLLTMKSQDCGVAEQMIAKVDDLQDIAAGNPEAKPLKGWRRELFGEDALLLCRGEAALTIEQDKIHLINLRP